MAGARHRCPELFVTALRRLLNVEGCAVLDIITAGLARAVDELMEQRLAVVARTAPAFAAALRAYRQAGAAGDTATAETLIAWIGGQKSVAASA